MNFKDLLMPLLFIMAVTIGLNYFFGDKISQKVDAERCRIAPKVEEINRPLNFAVDYIDSDLTLQPQLKVIETQFAKLTFNAVGAVLEKVEFKHDANKEIILMPTIESESGTAKCFLLAFETKTPLNYSLVDFNEDDKKISLKYKSTEFVEVSKEFIIYKDIPKIEIQIYVDATELNQHRLRLFFPSPLVQNLKNDTLLGLANDGKEISKRNIDVVKEGRYWEAPTLFGSEDRYFIHVMTSDQTKFIQRAYFEVNSEANRLISILESAKLNKAATYSLNFYFGPKRLKLMEQVDSRLTGTLEYGWLEPISVPLLKLLNVFYDYVHNYGWAIILLTLLIKLLLLPFAISGQRRMQSAAKKQKELQSKIAYIKERYKDDKETMQREQAELIKKHGLPGFGGCLPLLIQIPIFFALQRILYNSVELYKASFLWIPDLSSYDPWYVLPISVGLGMLFSGIGSTGMFGPKTKKGFDLRTQLPQYALAMILSAFMFSMSAGSVLYISLTTWLTVLHNFIQKKLQRV